MHAQESSFSPQQLTWAALLGRWIEFARSAVALPENEDGSRMRASIPDIIMLQAVSMSLQHLRELSAAERCLGLDRATILVEKHERSLEKRWGADQPDGLVELIADAKHALAQAEFEYGGENGQTEI